MKTKKAIGILGGMGPQASAYLYKTLIELSINKFNAKNNDDFPEIILCSIPVPDFISDEEKKNQALKMLQTRVKALDTLDLSCLSIACNTAHLLLDDLQNISKIPFVSMIDAVCFTAKEDKIKKIGILGTPSTLKSGLYQKKLEKYSIESLIPEEKYYLKLENSIRNVIDGTYSQQDANELRKIANILQKKGAEAIILGCTELPIVFPKDYSLPIYNSVEILAFELLRKYYKSNTIRA